MDEFKPEYVKVGLGQLRNDLLKLNNRFRELLQDNLQVRVEAERVLAQIDAAVEILGELNPPTNQLELQKRISMRVDN